MELLRSNRHTHSVYTAEWTAMLWEGTGSFYGTHISWKAVALMSSEMVVMEGDEASPRAQRLNVNESLWYFCQYAHSDHSGSVFGYSPRQNRPRCVSSLCCCVVGVAAGCGSLLSFRVSVKMHRHAKCTVKGVVWSGSCQRYTFSIF